MSGNDEFTRIWNDQLEFNNQFRKNPMPSFEGRAAETKELTLHLISECDELLRASGAWKVHRRIPIKENREAVRLEIADAFKYLLSIAQVHGFSPEEFLQGYWHKSMVVRQRYAEEFVKDAQAPKVILDIDNVLADYITGMLRWLRDRNEITDDTFVKMTGSPRYLAEADLCLTRDRYNQLKHEFRVSGEHANLPLMPGAREFMHWCFQQGWLIVLLTSRPITEYPNLHAETLSWLTRHELPFDLVWWARDKGEILLDRDVVSTIQFAVDDEWQYVQQLARQGIHTFWRTTKEQVPDPYIDVIRTLGEIPRKMEHLTKAVKK